MTVSDLISRDEAIKAIKKRMGNKPLPPTEIYTYFGCIDEIKAIPSAETHDKRTETHGVCSDLIRRSDAMGAVQDHFNADGFKGYDDGQQMMDRINALPSAEARPTGADTTWSRTGRDAPSAHGTRRPCRGSVWCTTE